MNNMQVVSGVLALFWLFATGFFPYRSPVGYARLLAAMIAIGVPVLGWLTLHWGPGVGLAAFAAGLSVILHRNRRGAREDISQEGGGGDLPKRVLR